MMERGKKRLRGRGRSTSNLSARKEYPKLPILFMSGYAEEQLRKSIDIQNVAFLPKPFSVQQLAEAARTALVPK